MPPPMLALALAGTAPAAGIGVTLPKSGSVQSAQSDQAAEPVTLEGTAAVRLLRLRTKPVRTFCCVHWLRSTSYACPRISIRKRRTPPASWFRNVSSEAVSKSCHAPLPTAPSSHIHTCAGTGCDSPGALEVLAAVGDLGEPTAAGVMTTAGVLATADVLTACSVGVLAVPLEAFRSPKMGFRPILRPVRLMLDHGAASWLLPWTGGGGAG